MGNCQLVAVLGRLLAFFYRNYNFETSLDTAISKVFALLKYEFCNSISIIASIVNSGLASLLPH